MEPSAELKVKSPYQSYCPIVSFSWSQSTEFTLQSLIRLKSLDRLSPQFNFKNTTLSAVQYFKQKLKIS